MSTVRRVVLDASALVAWACKERGADTVSKVLPYSVVPASAMTETLYRARERGHEMEAHPLQRAILAMGVEVEPITEDDCFVAARIIEVSRSRRQKPNDPCLSLGDGLCIAAAERLNLPITGGDNYWTEIWPELNLTIQFHPFR